MTKNIFRAAVFFFPWFWPLLIWALPSALNFQGRLTDPSGNPLSRPTQVDFYLFQGGHDDIPDEGTIVYKERVILNPGPEGLYEHHLGKGTPLESHTLTAEDFDTDLPLYLQMMIQGSPLLPRLQILASAYAMMASRVARGSIRQDNMDLVSFQQEGTGLVPPGAILLFLSACPEGFSEVSQLRNRLPIGTDTFAETPLIPDQINQPLGSFGHQHPIAHAHTTEISVSNSQQIGTGQDWVSFPEPRLIKRVAALGGGDNIYIDGYVHEHTTLAASPSQSGIAETIPPALTVMFCKKN